MEYVIAIGLGAWFVLAGIASCILVFKDYAPDKNEDEKK